MEQIKKHKELSPGYKYYQAKLFPFAYNVIGDTLAAEDVGEMYVFGYVAGVSCSRAWFRA